MHRFFCFLTALAISLTAIAQTPSSKDFQDRYDLLVSKLGPTGVGIETLLDRWAAAYPDDVQMLTGKFSYWFSKSQTLQLVPKDQQKFLGETPTVVLKDSTGANVNYFQETMYDDELFGEAQKALEKAIQLYPDRLDLRFLKVASLIGYEKESPDMALSSLKSLMIYNATQHPKWEYPGVDNVDNEFFSAALQEYCYLFFRYGTPATYEAFKELSEQMLTYEPKNVLFLDNIGSYWLVARKDNKTAMKYYSKVLKIKADDLTAIKNIIILARNSNNVKLEKKYLPQLIKYTQDEKEKITAQARLKSLNS
ncbi:MAG: hypothetical protein SOR84_00075 [Candidatus Cryptobacteroides sp.]|nr:hypothetical protein [Candidatus Cryptobacteroides sp.]